MKTKLMMSLIVIGIAGLMMGAGTFAYFNDTETSTGNTMTAGNLDLALSSGGPYQDTWSGSIGTVSNLAPGDETDVFDVYFKNVGSIDGIVTVDMSYTESDFTPETGEFAGTDVSANAFAKHLWVTYADVDDSGTNAAPWWAEQIIADIYTTATAAKDAGAVVSDPGNGAPHQCLPTMFGLQQITLHFWDSYTSKNDEVFSPNESHKENVKFKLDPNVGNAYQFDGIDIIITATMNQN